MNTTIQRQIEARRLQELSAPDDEIAGLWGKALLAYGDASSPGVSEAGRLLRAYDAGRLAALTIVREAGYRPRGAEGQHFITFEIARSLVTDRDLRQVLDDVNDLRLVRHQVAYEYQDDTDEAAVARAVELARRAIDLGAAYLREARPSLAGRITTEPRGA